MKIESILKRAGGTKVTIEGVEYHFKADKDGREYAEVSNDSHAAIFLSIPEGYARVETVALESPVVATQPNKPKPVKTERNESSK